MIEPFEERLFVPEGNDPKLLFTIYAGDNRQDLSNQLDAIEFFIKPSRESADVDGTILTLGNGDIVLTNPGLGEGYVLIPSTAIETAGLVWYRLDVVIAGQRRTPRFGDLVVQDV